jgi:hypothetical protein
MKTKGGQWLPSPVDQRFSQLQAAGDFLFSQADAMQGKLLRVCACCPLPSGDILAQGIAKVLSHEGAIEWL